MQRKVQLEVTTTWKTWASCTYDDRNSSSPSSSLAGRGRFSRMRRATELAFPADALYSASTSVSRATRAYKIGMLHEWDASRRRDWTSTTTDAFLSWRENGAKRRNGFQRRAERV